MTSIRFGAVVQFKDPAAASTVRNSYNQILKADPRRKDEPPAVNGSPGTSDVSKVFTGEHAKLHQAIEVSGNPGFEILA